MKTKKPKYGIWSNTLYMLRVAWRVHKPVVLMCLLLAAADAGKATVEMLIAPMVLGKVETGAPLSQLIGTIGIFSALLLLTAGLGVYIDRNTIFGRVQYRSSIIQDLGRKIAYTSYPNLMDPEFIRMENRAMDATSSNQQAVEQMWSSWTDILTNLLGFVVYLGVLSGLNPFLAGVVMVTTVLGYFVNKRIRQWSYRHREEEQTYTKQMNYARTLAVGREYAKDIRIFGLRAWVDDIWQDAMNLYEGFLKKREGIYLWMNVVDLVLALLRNGIAYGYLIWLTLTEGMLASEFLLYFSAASGFTLWITGILDKFSKLHKESMELSNIREFLNWEEPFRFDDGKPLTPAPDGKYEIRLENVSYRYPEAQSDTIHDVNVTIHPGEKVAIVGLNGAGKTTLVKLICGFLDPTRGRVLLNGQDIRQYDRRDYYRLLSAVFQDFSLLETSIAENISQSRAQVDLDRAWSCLEKAGLTETIRALPKGIETKLGRRVYEDGIEMSGGQIQRLMLARALYKDGPILALDEPTAALDPIAENDIYMKYNEMTAGKTSVFISHRLASTRFCDRILFVEDGRISQEGTHDDLMQLGGGYAKLFEIQSRYYKEGGEPA